jgi:hypothetical protein
MLKRALNLAGIYLRKAKTLLGGCSYPKTLKMKPSSVTKASPSAGTQFLKPVQSTLIKKCS